MTKKVFKKPTTQEITNYLHHEKNYDEFTAQGFAEKFWHYYESKGWMIGKSPMKDWKAAIRTWELNDKKNEANRGTFKQGTASTGTSTDRIDALGRW